MKINVLIITYCQQNLIERALNSILSQDRSVLNKIIISDDHSSDDTWGVIMNYKNKYPDIIEAYSNDINLGIYENVNQVFLKRGNADLYCLLAGDDSLCEGWFKKVNQFVTDENIPMDAPVGIFCKWKYVTEHGVEGVIDSNNEPRSMSRKLLGLALRGKLTTRSLLLSESVIESVSTINTSKGVAYSELTLGMQIMCLISKPFFLDYIGSVYYMGIGVSKGIESYDPSYYTDSTRDAYEYIINHYVKDKEDLYLLRAKINAINFIKKHDPAALFNSLWQYLLSTKGYGLNIKEIIDYYRFVMRKAYRNNIK